MKRILLFILFSLVTVSPVMAGTHYAVNLESTVQPLDMASLPDLELLKQHQLYTTVIENEGELWHRLRLGFFPDEQSAEEVLKQLKEDFPRAWVTRVSEKEYFAYQEKGRAPVDEVAENRPADHAEVEQPMVPLAEPSKQLEAGGQSTPAAAAPPEPAADRENAVSSSAKPESRETGVASEATSPTATGPQVLIKPAAVVNNNIITTYQLDNAVQQSLAENKSENQPGPEQLEELRQKILEQLIDNELLSQRIKELGLQVSDAEVEAAIEDVQRNNKLSREMLTKALADQGMSFESYREQVKKELLRYKLFGREVNYKVQVTSSEVRDYFREHIDQYRLAPRIRISHLSFAIPQGAGEETLAALRKRAEDCRDRLLGGESFEKVLADQGTAASGGDMGMLVEQDLSEQLRDALAGLEVGQVTEPLVMNDQLHLFQVTERNPGDIHLFDRASGEIEEILKRQKTEARFKEWNKELRENSKIEIRL